MFWILVDMWLLSYCYIKQKLYKFILNINQRIFFKQKIKFMDMLEALFKHTLTET